MKQEVEGDGMEEQIEVVVKQEVEGDRIDKQIEAHVDGDAVVEMEEEDQVAHEVEGEAEVLQRRRCSRNWGCIPCLGSLWSHNCHCHQRQKVVTFM